MRYYIYWLINERKTKTYIGMTADVGKRLEQHKNKLVKSTRDFGLFSHTVLETVEGFEAAYKRERYWKSAAGRKKLKRLFIMALSSSG